MTGGASAAWGSDAVAGVVNLILNKNFTGFKASMEGSDTYNDTYRTFKTTATWGFDFAGGRGHVILSGEYRLIPSAAIQVDEPWFNDAYLVNNPNYNAVTNPTAPQLIHENNVGLSTVTAGGLILQPDGQSSGHGQYPAWHQFRRPQRHAHDLEFRSDLQRPGLGRQQ